MQYSEEQLDLLSDFTQEVGVGKYGHYISQLMSHEFGRLRLMGKQDMLDSTLLDLYESPNAFHQRMADCASSRWRGGIRFMGGPRHPKSPVPCQARTLQQWVTKTMSAQECEFQMPACPEGRRPHLIDAGLAVATLSILSLCGSKWQGAVIGNWDAGGLVLIFSNAFDELREPGRDNIINPGFWIAAELLYGGLDVHVTSTSVTVECRWLATS